MEKKRAEALEIANRLVIARAEIEVNMINSAPEEMLDMLLDKSRAELDRVESMLKLTRLVVDFADKCKNDDSTSPSSD